MLLPQHLQYLSDRGIPEQAARDAGYRSVTEAEKLVAVGYGSAQALHVPGLLIPLFDAQGELASHQYRADQPRLNRNGKALKFDNPRGSRNRVTYPGTAAHAVHHRDVPLVVIEGPVKALSVWHNLHLPAATITGTWNWVGKAGLGAQGSTALADWREIDLAGREVWIAFDTDVRTNSMVRTAAEQLGAMLGNRKARVSYVLLPELEEDNKAGLDDLLANGVTLDEVKNWLVQELPKLPVAARGRAARQEVAAEADVPFTDRERAEAWWEYAGQYDIRRVQREDSWHYYDGARWVDYGNKETGLHISVTRYLAGLADDVAGLIREASDAEKRSLREIQRSLESSYAAQQVATWAKKMPELYVPWGFFDPSGDAAYLLNCSNGTLDLRDLGFKSHDPEDRLTGIAPTPFDPDAEAPDWEAFIAEILPDEEVRLFVQRVLGMALIADPGVQGAFVFHGKGANGKGAMMRVISRVLGPDYSTMVPRNTIQKSNKEEHPTQFLEFRGRRMAWLDEFPASSSFSEHNVKELTGGGDIKARGMRQDFVQFRPTHTLFVTTNYLPEVSSDYAMWRRLHRVPFDVEIPVERRDENREVRIVRDEASGVLNWLIAGFSDFWARSGRGSGPGRLDVPTAVVDATEEWRQGQDHVSQFLASVVTPQEGQAVQVTELRKLYVAWVQEQDIPFGTRLNQNNFVSELQKRGYEVRQNHRLGAVRSTWLLGYQTVTKELAISHVEGLATSLVASVGSSSTGQPELEAQAF